MGNGLRLFPRRWEQEEFFTVSDAVLIATRLDQVFNDVEEFQAYADEISRLIGEGEITNNRV